MLLSLEKTLKILFEEKIITREEYELEKKKSRLGRKNCRILKKVVAVFRTDYSKFFPRKPCGKTVYEATSRLLRIGGVKYFQEEIKENSETSTCEQGVQADLVIYREESELETSIVSKTQKKFLRESQENSPSQGSGSNNPRLSIDTRHDYMILFASDTPISAIIENDENYFNEFKVFADPSDEQVRKPASKPTLYRWRKNLVVVSIFQIEEFVNNAEHLTICSDGTTTRSNREVIAIVFANEKREVILYNIVELFGKTAADLTAALVGSVNHLPFAEEVWRKCNSLLTDTCPAQLSSNNEVIAFIREKRGDPTLVIDQLWCTLHTASNLDKYGREKISTDAKEALTGLKLVFGSSTTSGHHRDDLKNSLMLELERQGIKPSSKPFCTDVGSRIGASKKNSEDLLLYFEPVVAVLKANPENKRAPDLLSRLENRAEIILKTSFIPLVWASFSGPILRSSERQDEIEQVRDQMEACLSGLNTCVKSPEPYSCLVDAVLTENKESDYFRKLQIISAQPRSEQLQTELNETTINVLNEVKKKLEKDFGQMSSIKLTGRYRTSNRYCESVFGHLKKREQTNVKATLETTVCLTVAKMNDSKSFLKKMTKTRREKMWKQIEDKTTLERITTAREELKKKLREQAKLSKEAKREKKKKTAENKRKKEEKKKEIAEKPKKRKKIFN